MTSPILRFAPSPNGALHLGHAYSALLNERMAQRLGGVLRLRLEDIDRARCRPEHEAGILADLAWLGVAWTGRVWRQSDRFPAYAAALAALRDMGLLYPCVCTRGDIARAVAGRPDWPRDPDGASLYPGTCRYRRAGSDDRPAWRLDMAAALRRCPPALSWAETGDEGRPARIAAEPSRWGDVLLARKDVPTSYHLSVVVDDAAQQVTHVVRGEDLRAATGLHRMLQVLLGYPEPTYRHHRLIRDDAGSKLSKSRGSASLAGLRDQGVTAAEVRRGFDLDLLGAARTPGPVGQGM